MNTDAENLNAQEGHLDLGFVLEISSINENWDTAINQDTLADVTNSAFANSGYLGLWDESSDPDDYVNEEGILSGLWIDPTSTFSYLYALTGTVHGDILSIDFRTKSAHLDADSWEAIRSKILMSLRHDFILEEHSHDFEKSPQSFYVNNLHINGSGTLTSESLYFAIRALQASSETCAAAKEFVSLYTPEITVSGRLPEFLSGHIWAQLLSGCNWKTVQRIISQDSELVFDSESFSWLPPENEDHFYTGGWAVQWFRGVRRSLNFTPWPWQEESITDQYDLDETALFRAQVKETLGREEPSSEERVAALAVLLFLIADDDDDYVQITGRLQEIRDNWVSEPLQAFVSSNEALIRECFAAMPEEWQENGVFLPEWSGSEGVLASVPESYGSPSEPETLHFDGLLLSRVDEVWDGFMKIASQQLPEG